MNKMKLIKLLKLLQKNKVLNEKKQTKLYKNKIKPFKNKMKQSKDKIKQSKDKIKQLKPYNTKKFVMILRKSPSDKDSTVLRKKFIVYLLKTL